MLRNLWGTSRRASVELSKCIESIRSRRYPNAIFIWIPKTGGTSVYQMLRECGFVKLKSVRDVQKYFSSKGRVTFGHMSLAELLEQQVIDRGFVESSLKFVVVRNPYARAVSCYNHAATRGYFKRWNRPPTFTEFLEMVRSGFIERVDARNNSGFAFCNPQAVWLRDIEVDWVFRLERLIEDVPIMRELFACPDLSLGHANRSAGVDVHDLTAEDRQLIQEIYREDFERFGYPKGKP